MSMCDDCIHKNICKFENEMHKLESEIVEKSKLTEYVEFVINIKCKHYHMVGNLTKCNYNK